MNNEEAGDIFGSLLKTGLCGMNLTRSGFGRVDSDNKGPTSQNV